MPGDDYQQLGPSHPLSPRFTPESATADAEMLVGFVGDAPVESRVRVYSDLSFTSFYEFDRAEVQVAVPVDAHEEDGPTVVKVRGDARIEFVTISRLAGEASYVAGNIRAKYRSAQDDVAFARDELLPPYPVSRVYPPCSSLPPPYPVSRVYPPCPSLPPPYPVSRVYPPC